MKTDDPLSEVMALLAAERNALIVGDYKTLASISTRKDVALGKLDMPRLPPTGFEIFRKALRHNSDLINAAIVGFQNAQEHLSNIYDAQEAAIYDRNGTRSAMRCDHTLMERKV